jgi:flagellar basal-body rod modification protein FlgD
MNNGGQRVRRLELGSFAPGQQTFTWDGRNDQGRDVAPGVYTAWVIASGVRLSVKLVRVP